MKSPALNRLVQSVYGVDGEVRLLEGLAQLESAAPELIGGLRRLIQGADAACAQYAFIHQLQAELSGDMLAEWNLRSGAIESGRKWKEFFGYAQDALDDTVAAWQSLLHPDDLTAVRSALAAHVRGERSEFGAECRMKGPGGGWRWIQLRGKISVRSEQGEPQRLLILHRDISEVRATEAALVAAKEAAEAANRARGSFLANVSHEIRTPLNGVIGMTELALDTKLDSEQRHYLKTVKASADSLLSLINDILDFSKIEAGKLQFETISFSPVAVLQEAARTVAVGAQRKGLELVIGVGDGVPERVVGDPTRLRQVFLNLLGNAIKFTERGEVVVRVEMECLADASVYLKGMVSDTGIGIPKGRQQSIFEAFAQADSSTTRRFGGTGLGLAICARLVQLMDGRIELDSEEGRGSCFTFTARFGREECAERAIPELPGARDATALILEANATTAHELSRSLGLMGVKSALFSEAAVALEALRQAREGGRPFQYVFADGAMAAPGGLALISQWLLDEPPEKLVMLIGHEHSRQGMEELQARSMGGCLLKPVVPEDVREALLLLQSGRVKVDFDLAPFDLQPEADVERKRLEVLLVEDNPVNQELAKRLLEKYGHHVRIANDGMEAVELFDQHQFDVIFMDMQMPVMGGLEATEAIRAKELRRSWVVSEDYRQVPIVAMTANAMVGDRERCLDAGMNAYLSKPLRIEELERVLASLEGDALMAHHDGADEAAVVLNLAAAEKDLGDRKLVLQMAVMLLANWDDHLGTLSASLSARDAVQLFRESHSLKSLVAIFHAEQARRAALALEHACEKAAEVDWATCTRLVDELRAALVVLKPQLEDFAARG